MSGLRSAFGLLTVLPAGGTYDARAAVAWFTPVGVLIGALLSVATAGAFELWAPAAAAAVIAVLAVVLTGGLHLDGLADTADAAIAVVPQERRLAILRDVHHGTFAVVAVAAILLLKYGALAGHGRAGAAAIALAAAPIARAALLPAMRAFPPARAEGMGAAARQGATPVAMALGGGIAALTGFAALGWQGVALAAGVCVLALLLAAWLASRFGGLTGDTYGALVELSEAALLLGASALLSQGWAEPFPAGDWL